MSTPPGTVHLITVGVSLFDNIHSGITKLKKLLKESDENAPTDEDDDVWTAEDETAFVDELMNVQLQKVHQFQTKQSQTLRDRVTACEKKLEPLALGIKAEQKGNTESAGTDGKGSQKQDVKPEEREKLLKEVLDELDDITKEVNELEKFSRINYTAFFKATKKHDRKRGQSYRLRPFLETRLAAHPLNTEDHSPLLFRLSAMYSFVRQSLDGKSQEALSFAEDPSGGESFTSHKCMLISVLCDFLMRQLNYYRFIVSVSFCHMTMKKSYMVNSMSPQKLFLLSFTYSRTSRN